MKKSVLILVIAALAVLVIQCEDGNENPKLKYNVSIFPDTLSLRCLTGSNCSGTISVVNNGEPVTIDTISANVRWAIQFEPISFAMVKNSLKEVNVTVDASTLPSGMSKANCSAILDDGSTVDFVVACTLEAGKPKIQTTPDNFNLALTKGIQTIRDLIISNIGTEKLRITTITTDRTFINVPNYQNVEINPGTHDTIQIMFNTQSLDAGSYLGYITIESNDPESAFKSIAVRCSVFLPTEEVFVQPKEVYITCKQDSACTSSFVVYNTGASATEIISINSLASYLSFYPTRFTIYRNSNQLVEITANTAGLLEGTIHTTASITLDDRGYIDVPITLNILKRNAKLELTNPEIDIAVKPNTITEDTFKIYNTGDTKLVIHRLTSTADWLSIRPNPVIEIPPFGGQREFVATINSMGLQERQVYQAQITIECNDPDSVHYIPVRCSILTLVPKITYSRDSIRIEGKTNQDFAPAETLRIGNIGDGNLVVNTITPEPAWVIVSPSSRFVINAGEDEKVLLVTANTSALLPGIHQGYIMFQCNDPANPFKYIYITAVVSPELHSLRVNPSIIEMQGYTVPSFLARDTFQIYNVGDKIITVNQITTNQTWLKVDFGRFQVLDPGDTISVAIEAETGQLSTGNYEAWISIASNDPGLPEFAVPVKVAVKPFQIVQEKVMSGAYEWVLSLCYSHAGDYIAIGTSNNTVVIYNTERYTETTTMRGHNGWVLDVEFSIDDSRLASASDDNNIIIWDTRNWTQTKTLNYHRSRVRDLSFSPNGNFMASASDDQSILVWDTQYWGVVRTFSDRLYDVTSVTFSPDGQYLAAGTWQGFYIWLVKWWEEFKQITGCAGWVFGLEFNPVLPVMATGSDSELKLWNTGSWNSSILSGHDAMVWEVTFSPDGKYMASASSDRSVKIWYTDIWLELVTLKFNLDVNAVRFSPDGTKIAIGTDEGKLYIYSFR